jgi:hypothetical protein
VTPNSEAVSFEVLKGCVAEPPTLKGIVEEYVGDYSGKGKW